MDEFKKYTLDVTGLPFKDKKEESFSRMKEISFSCRKSDGGEFTCHNVVANGILEKTSKHRESIDNNCCFVYPLGISAYIKIHGFMINGWRTIADGNSNSVYSLNIGISDMSGSIEPVASYDFTSRIDKIHDSVMMLKTPVDLKRNMTLVCTITVSNSADKNGKSIETGDISIYYE